jgi:CBS domain-containing protein
MDIQTLKQTDGLKSVPDRTLQRLLEACGPECPVAEGEHLYREGDEYQGRVFLVCSGSFELSSENRPPRLSPPGYLMGLSSYLSDAPYTSSARAIAPSSVLAIEAAELRAIEREHPPLAAAFDRFIRASLELRRVNTGVGPASLSLPVSRAMSSPVVGCHCDTPLAEAVARMTHGGVGSLVLDDAGSDMVVTYASLARCLVRPGTRPGSDPVRDAGVPISRIDATDPLWHAQDIQLREGAKYLLVEQAGRPVGMLSQTDVVRVLRAREARIAVAAQDAADFESLRTLYESLTEVASDFLQANRLARVAVRALSDIHLTLQRRCIDLTLQHFEAEGNGPAPGPFALVIMGSGGRREMLLDPDQDNALILDDTIRGNLDADQWFERFADRLNVNLDACGYILCPGDIMARNPMFRKSLSEWKTQITRMCEHPNEKAARWSSIAFDFDTQYGDASLTRRFREHVNAELAQRPRLLNFMVDDDAQGRAPINWFNQLVATGERDGHDTVDVKRNGLRMVANAARILALRNGIFACNTSERISALTRNALISRDMEATVLDAYDELLAILLSHQIRQRRAGLVPDKQVAPDDLTAPERESLRIGMRAVKRFQEFLQDSVGGVRL